MIKFADLQVKNELAILNVVDVMRSGHFINGFHNHRFAEIWAKECNAEDCILTASGMAALIAVLKCMRTAQSDKVIVPALSFAATAFAVLEAGCMPVYVDVDEQGLINWNQVESILVKYGRSILAVMPVHLYGQIVPIPSEIRERIPVIEDACQAHGKLQFDDTPAIACFSFYPSKNLGAIGDAGAIVLNGMPDLGRRVAAYINYGNEPGDKYVHGMQGNNLRCDEIQAAYLTEAYQGLEYNNTMRDRIVMTYAVLAVPSYAYTGGQASSHHLYPILVKEPHRFQRLMIDYGVETGMHYPYTLPAIAHGIKDHAYPNASRIANHVITLPIGPHMSVEDVAKVADVIHNVCKLDDGMWSINL